MLKLASFTRIAPEKGIERMRKMESLIPFPFQWDLYSSLNTDYAKKEVKKFKKINFKGFCDKPLDKMKEYDYIVQVSDMEGFAYSVIEALKVKVPVIITDFKVAKEMVRDGKDGYIIPMDLNFDWNKLLKVPHLGTYKEKSNEQDWMDIL